MSSSVALLLASLAGWHGIYDDAPVRVRVAASRRVFHVGDTFELQVTALNTSDRTLLLRRDWREQLSFYHLHPQTGEQVEWPGRVCNAAVIDSNDVVRLDPGERYSVKRRLKVLTGDDVAEFDFRVRLWGVKDYGERFRMWAGSAWSGPIRVRVRR
jgi:hypothetical protein